MDFIIDARTYLPNFMKDSALMSNIVDCLNVLISSEQPIFEQIKEAYQDTLYRCRDYSKLTYEAKVNIIKELGFEYLINIFTLSSDQLTRLLIFFNLIYALKGKKEGLYVCLDALGLTYTYTPWDELSPKGVRFTADLVIVGNEYADNNILKKIKNFVRSYMLPWINISVELTIDCPPIYVYPSGFINLGIKSANVPVVIRDVANVAVYDRDLYDASYYGALIFSGPDQDDPYIFDDVLFKITSNQEDAIITIDGEQVSEKMVERGALIPYCVTYGDQVVDRTMVCNKDRTLEINFEEF